MRLQFGSVLVISIMDDVLNGRNTQVIVDHCIGTYHGAFTIARSSFNWNIRMIAMLDLDAQPHNSRP